MSVYGLVFYGCFVNVLLEILAHVAKIFEQFVDVSEFTSQRLVQPSGEIVHSGKRLPQILHGLPDVGAILSDERIDMVQCLIRLRRSLSQILE